MVCWIEIIEHPADTNNVNHYLNKCENCRLNNCINSFVDEEQQKKATIKKRNNGAKRFRDQSNTILFYCEKGTKKANKGINRNKILGKLFA